ncbi:MAG: SulP family inorganic anion transporter [Propionicimonas sp.]
MDDGVARGWRRWLPGLAVLTSYDRGWLRPDIIAGLTVSAYLVPQVMAYAEIVGLPPVVGLWATLAPMLTYAVLGTSRQLSVGPESTTALMTAVAIVALAGEVDGQRRAEVAAVLALACGVVFGVARLARLGFLANLLSKPVLVGYLAGIGILMVVSQYATLTKLTIAGDHPWQETMSLISQWQQIHVPTLTLALGVAAALFAMYRWAPRWPGPLLVMLAAAALVAATGLAETGVEVIGEIPRALPALVVPSLEGIDVLQLLVAAVGISVVAYSDVILTGRSFAARRNQRIDADAELLAMGAANLINGFVCGLPSSASASRTVIGDAAGSRTQLHSLVAAALMLGAIFVFSPVLAAFPQAALAGLVVYAGLRLVDLAELRRIARFRRSELVLALVTFAAVLATGLLVGVGIAIALSLLDLIRRIVHPHDGVLGFIPGLAGMHDIDDYPHSTLIPGLLVYRYDSPLFFANAEDFRSRALAAVEEASSPVRWFVLNAEANVEVDLTAVDVLEELRQALETRGIVFALARVKSEVRVELEATGLLDRIGPELMFATLPTAVAAYRVWHQRELGSDPGPPPGSGSQGDGTVAG